MGRAAGLVALAEAGDWRLATFMISPAEARVTIRLVPPYETNGSGTPVSGASPRTAKRLIVAWTMTSVVSPAASSFP